MPLKSDPKQLSYACKQHYCLGFVIAGDAVLLIQKARPEWQKGKLNGVGGHVEPGESPLAAMRREFLEETGMTCDQWDYFFVMEFPDAVVHCYRSVWDGTVAIPEQFITGDEPVRWINTKWLTYHFDDTSFLPGLLWLVPLAIQFTGGGPYVQRH